MKKVIATKNAPAAIGPYSQGILINNTLYVSGQLPLDPETGDIVEGIEAQAERSLKNVIAIVEEAGLTAADVVKTTILLKDINDFGIVNEIYSKFFTSDCPARACYQVANVPKGALLEVEAIAAAGEENGCYEK